MVMNNSKEVKTGFRKKFTIVISILSAIVLFGSMVYHVVSGNIGHMLSDTEMYILIALMGINLANYTAARALPGSPEYTNPEHRQFDSTLQSTPPQQVSMSVLPPEAKK